MLEKANGNKGNKGNKGMYVQRLSNHSEMDGGPLVLPDAWRYRIIPIIPRLCGLKILIF